MKPFPFLATLAVILVMPLISAQTGRIGELVAIGDNAGGLNISLDDNDLFGESFADLGDLDGDGIHEVAVGSLADDDGGPGRGAVYILFRKSDGSVRSWQKISATSGGFTGNLMDIDLFGSAAAGLGDLDGDGVPDLAVGAYGDDSGGLGRGAVWLLFLNADGTVHNQLRIASGVGGFGGMLSNGDFFGSALANLGDLDGDGTLELAVGAPFGDDGGQDAGAIWIVSINAGGATAQQLISATSGGFGGSLGASDLFGYSVCALGDLDGDGVNDLGVGAPSGSVSTGKAWILFLEPDGTVKAETELSPATEPLLASILSPCDSFGTSVAPLGDLNDDGVLDMAVGAWAYDDALTNSGAICLLFLRADGTISSTRVLSDTEPLLAPELTSQGLFGRAMGLIEDPTAPWLFCSTNDLSQSPPSSSKGAALGMRLCSGDLEPNYSVDVTTGSVPLSVTFQDLSRGTNITSWEWEFGDGGTSSDQNPVYAYQLPGTYDVILRIQGPGSFCSTKKKDLITVIATDLVTPRNGSGVNPDVYRELNLPLVGTTWLSRIDGTGMGWGGLTFLIAYEDPLLGVLTAFGELLVDISSPLQAFDIGVFAGANADHGVPIPNDPSLVGLTFSTQAFVNNPGVLTNALDIIIGQ